MAAGDLLTANYQIEVDGVLYGTGATVWSNDEKAWSGFFGSGVRDQDTTLALADGEVAATDTNPARVLTMAFTTAGANRTEAQAYTDATSLDAAWNAGGDTVLHYQLPGIGHCSIAGRTRGALIDMELAPQGVVRALCTFKACEPTITVVDATP